MTIERVKEFFSFILTWILEQSFELIGFWALIIFVVIVLTYWFAEFAEKWETLNRLTRSGSSKLWTLTRRFPRASGRNFSVLVARLENDEGNNYQNLIYQAISQLSGIEVYRLANRIEMSPDKESVTKGHGVARRYLKRANADAIVWGSVVKKDAKSLPNLHWTLQRDSGRSGYFSVLDDLHFSSVFWEELVNVLVLAAVSQYLELAQRPDPRGLDGLRDFTSRVEKLIRTEGLAAGWDSQSATNVSFVLANALLILGDISHDNEALDRASELFKRILKNVDRKKDPVRWAGIQNNLGRALVIRGAQQPGRQLLDQGVRGIRASLSALKKQSWPQEWAVTQGYLGNALSALGERDRDASTLKAAVSAHESSLTIWSREKTPNAWAVAKLNLGIALRRLADFKLPAEAGSPDKSGREHAERAVQSYYDALSVRTWRRTPVEWACTKIDLAVALLALSDRREDREQLRRVAVRSARSGVRVLRKSRFPVQWAKGQHALGMALLQLAGNGQTRTLRRAIRALEAASNVYREDREPVLCAAVRSNLGFALAKDGIARRDVRVALKGLELALNAWSILAREMPVPARASAEQIVLILGRLWTTKSLRETPEFVGFIQENGIRLMEVEVPQSMYPTAGTFSGSPSQLGALFILSPPASHGTEDMDEFALAAGYGTIGTILASAGRVEDAIAWLRRTVELRPDDQEGVYNLGLAYHLQGKLDAACLLLRKARALAPRDTATLNTLGLCLMDSGNRDEAKEVFVSLVEADPSFVKGWNNLALLLIQLNDHKGAANCFRRVVALSPRPDESAFLDQAYQWILRIAADCVTAGDELAHAEIAEALEAGELLLLRDSEDAETHRNLSTVLQYDAALLDNETLRERAQHHREEAARITRESPKKG